MVELNPGETLYRLIDKEWVPVSNRPIHFSPDAANIEWLSRAAHLPGRAFHLASAVVLRSKLEKNRVIRLPDWILAKFNVPRDGKAYRLGLRTLEKAGLIAVDRSPGRKAIISVLPISSTDSAGTRKS